MAKGGKGKKPENKAAKKAAQKTAPPAESSDKAAAKRVAKAREKLIAAMEDPDVRMQIARAISAMMREEKE